MAPPSTPDKFPSEALFDTLIKVDVGEGDDKRTFEVFKGVLCFYSGYFQAALNGRFKEAVEGAVKLPTEDTQVFELFIHFIHTRRFYDSTLAPEKLLGYDMLAKLWVFGDAHEVPLLQNAIVDIWKVKTCAWDAREEDPASVSLPDAQTIDYVLENTVSEAALRTLLIDVISMMLAPKPISYYQSPAKASREWYVEGTTDLHAIILESTLARPSLWQWRAYEICHWHVHPDGVDCSSELEGKSDRK